MLRWLKQTFDGPQIWLTIGVVLIALSLVVGYHQDQRLADVTLAKKVDLPSPVAIQAFSQDKHTNMLGEFQLLTEVNLGDAGIHRIGDGDMQEAYLLVPAYPLSEGGQRQASTQLRETAGAPAARQSPVAILVYDISANSRAPVTFDNIGLQSLGSGHDGDVVLLAGTMFDRAMWQDALSGTAFSAALVDFLGEGADLLPLIAPYRDGKTAGGAAVDLARLEYFYFAFGMAFILCSGVMLSKRYIPDPQRNARKPKVGTVRKPSIPPLKFFQPIVSQEDLIDADQDAPPSVHVPKFVARAADAIARGGKSRAKSRL